MLRQSDTAIISALSAYRERIAASNYHAMSSLVPQIELVEPDGDLFESQEDAEEARLEFVLDLVGPPENGTEPPIRQASDILTHWDALTPQLALDGAAVNHDSEWRAHKRMAYSSIILQGLARFECPTGIWTFPHDLEIVMLHCDSLEGHGYRKLRAETEALIFFEGWGRNRHESPQELVSRVKTPQDLFNFIPGLEVDYEVATGWQCGTGNESSCYVIYCRQNGDEGAQWSWRYVASLGQFGIEVFDDMVALLEWYQDYCLPTENFWDLITPETVFEC